MKAGHAQGIVAAMKTCLLVVGLHAPDEMRSGSVERLHEVTELEWKASNKQGKFIETPQTTDTPTYPVLSQTVAAAATAAQLQPRDPPEA